MGSPYRVPLQYLPRPPIRTHTARAGGVAEKRGCGGRGNLFERTRVQETDLAQPLESLDINAALLLVAPILGASSSNLWASADRHEKAREPDQSPRRGGAFAASG